MGLELATTPSVRMSVPGEDLLSGFSAPSISQVVTFCKHTDYSTEGEDTQALWLFGAVCGALDRREGATQLQGALHLCPSQASDGVRKRLSRAQQAMVSHGSKGHGV